MTFKIYSNLHTLFAAKHLRDQLERLGHSASLVDSINTTDKETYIIYNASAVQQMPSKFIIYQTEISKSHWFNPRYYSRIRRAVAVWDYSETNVKRYESFNNNIHVISPGISPQHFCHKKDIGVTFYGWIDGSARRKRIITDIAKRFKINIVTNTLDSAMWKILARTKVVLNVHYYDNSPLELFRVHEALSFGCHVVSEQPGVDRYNGLVHFADMNNGIVDKLNEISKKDFKYNIKTLDNFEELKQALKTI